MPYCANCGTQVAVEATACPSCGRPQGPAGVVAAGGGVAGARRTDGQATASLVLGILGVAGCPLIPSIIALVLGNQAKARIAADPSLEGEGMAKAGVILGWIGIGLFAVGAVIWIALIVLSAAGGGFN